MNTFFKKKWITPFVALLLALASAGGTLAVVSLPKKQPAKTPETLYRQSVVDAMAADSEEIMPLVTITKENPLVTWNEAGDRVLLLSWHRHPESYAPGSEVVLTYGEVWTFTDREMREWYRKNKTGVEDWDMRLRQLIGLPPDAAYTHVTAFWANPDDVYRPAYSTDIESADMPLALEETTTEDYREWFDDNILFSYYDSAYPWTRLGYTYDWADNGTEYGLSEFLIAKDAKVTVEFTKTTQELIEWLAAG